MGNDSFPILLTGSATTTIGSYFLHDICINQTLTGTVTVKEGTTSVGAFAATTPPGDYMNLPNGGRFANLQITLSAGDNVTVYVRKA